MIRLRKIDLMLQAVLMAACLIMWPASPIMAAAGYFLLGAWQVISALFNSFTMSKGPFRQRILIYWLVTALDLILIAVRYTPLLYIALVAAAGIAVYYWVIYRLFINYLSHRTELSTIVRNG
ncbi:MAG: hypothetical protein WCF67_00665 [Chitinophagaceae bacterium]